MNIAKFFFQFFGEDIIFGQSFVTYIFEKYMKPMIKNLEAQAQKKYENAPNAHKLDIDFDDEDILDAMDTNAKMNYFLGTFFTLLIMAYFYKVSKRFTSLLPPAPQQNVSTQ